MNSLTDVLTWGSDCLVSNGYVLKHSPETVQSTPWSTVIRFSTLTGDFFLKHTPPALFLESKIIPLLSAKYHVSAAELVAVNDSLHCFLMKNAGLKVRDYLKTAPQSALLCQAIKSFTAMQRSTEQGLDAFWALGVPDWRLDKLPTCYQSLINQTDLLKSEGMTASEIQRLHDVIPELITQCTLLSHYPIPETLVQPDFNANNVLIDPTTQKMTLIDLGELAVTHPFFSLHNYLFQAIKHHGVKEHDHRYQQLQEAYFETWLNDATHQQLMEAFTLSKRLWPIYGALAYHRLMGAVDLQALKTFYADRPSQLATSLNEYLSTLG